MRVGPLGIPELAIIVVVILLIFGAKRLPEIGTSMGKGIRTFRRGMDSLISALEDSLRGRARITCGVIATSIEPSKQGACVTLDDGTRHEAELVIAATHARGAAALLAPHFGDAVAGLSLVPTLSSVTVELAFERAQVDHVLDGTGFVVAPEHQRESLSACTFTSAKFADRAPLGKVSLRLFFRPSPEQLHELDDDAWAERALRGVRRIVQVHGQPLRRAGRAKGDGQNGIGIHEGDLHAVTRLTLCKLNRLNARKSQHSH